MNPEYYLQNRTNYQKAQTAGKLQKHIPQVTQHRIFRWSANIQKLKLLERGESRFIQLLRTTRTVLEHLTVYMVQGSIKQQQVDVFRSLADNQKEMPCLLRCFLCKPEPSSDLSFTLVTTKNTQQDRGASGKFSKIKINYREDVKAPFLPGLGCSPSVFTIIACFGLSQEFGCSEQAHHYSYVAQEQ